MPRKNYKKYNNRKYKNYNTQNETEAMIKGIVVLTVFIGIGIYTLYNKYILPNMDNIIFFLKIIIPLLIISLGYIYYYLHKKRKNKEKDRIDGIPNFLLELESKIKSFKPLRNYSKEEPYQIELAGYLKNNYPDLDIEKSINYSRPDIVIDKIAIEIKGPTDMSGLKTLPDKINSYIPKWDYLFIVLFNIKITTNPEKSKEIYENKKREILENTIESKREKIFFIEIN